MIKTIKELLIEWWAGNLTTKMPLPIIYIYEVEVDGKTARQSQSRVLAEVGYTFTTRHGRNIPTPSTFG